MSKIILHIGTHKTGTTTLQDTFFQNRDLLARRGIIYPDIGRANGHHALVTKWATGLPEVYQVPGGSPKAWADLRAQYANSDKTLIISSEEFSRGEAPQTVDVKELRAEMAGFDEIEVVCVLRDQVSFLQSIYLELSKKHQPMLLPNFFKVGHNQKIASGLWLDYNRIYQHWLQAFAPEEIRLVSYQTATAHRDGVLGYFWDLFDIGGSVTELAPVFGGNSNVSPDPLASWTANTVASPKPAPRELVDLAYGSVERQFGAGVRTSLFSRAEVEMLRKVFDPLNAALEADVRKTHPDFVAPEIKSIPVEAAHRGKITALYWAKVAQDVYRNRESL